MKEAALSIFFLRPIVDAYRVAAAEEDDELAVTRLAELIINKGIELATENIPGCVLQLYVWLSSPEDAGTFALVSIGISTLTTGYLASERSVRAVRTKNEERSDDLIVSLHQRFAPRFSLSMLLSIV